MKLDLLFVFLMLATGLIVVGFLERFWLDVLIFALWYAYLCITWNIVGGFAGQFSFAHPVYIAIGGYTSTILMSHYQISPWFGMFAGMILAALLAAVLSWLNFKQSLPHLSYALITLAMTFILVVLLRSSDFLGASEGLFIIRGQDPLNFKFRNKESYFYIILLAVFLIQLFVVFLRRFRWGLYFTAVRDNQDAANMLGVDPLKVMVASSTISAGLGAFAGTFYAQYLFVIDPSIAGAELAVEIILFAAVGGLGTLWGPFFGPLILVLISRYLNQQFTDISGLGQVLYGLFIIVVLLILRDGIFSWLSKQRHLQKQVKILFGGLAGKIGVK